MGFGRLESWVTTFFVLVLLVFSIFPAVQASLTEEELELSVEASADPTTGTVPHRVNFTAVATGGTEPYSYLWDFGDNENSTVQNPTHTYDNADTYIATVTITDNEGTTADDNVIITVADFSVAVDPKDGWVDRKERLVQAGDTCTFDITVTNDGDNIDSYTLEVSDIAGWDLGLQEERFENLAAGESMTTTLSIAVPENAKAGSQDDITILVTNSAEVGENYTTNLGVLRGFDTNETYIFTGIGIVIITVLIVLVRWKGPLAGG